MFHYITLFWSVSKSLSAIIFTASSKHNHTHSVDLCLGSQSRSFVELETNLYRDIEIRAEYCKKWRLQPNTSKTVNNGDLASAQCKSEHKLGWNSTAKASPMRRLSRTGFDSGRSFSLHSTYHYHLKKTVAQHNLLSKFSCSTSGVSAQTLGTADLALLFRSWYCAPVCYFLSIRPCALSPEHWAQPNCRAGLRVIINIAPSYLRRKKGTARLLKKIYANKDVPFTDDITSHPPPRLSLRHPIWLDMP